MTEMPRETVETYRRQVFFDQAEARLAAMKRDQPEEWEALRAEDRAWEATLRDGMDDEPWSDEERGDR
jgi:hypothetical protein